jgi:hypothetical protein
MKLTEQDIDNMGAQSKVKGVLGQTHYYFNRATGERSAGVLLMTDRITRYRDPMKALELVAAHEFGHLFGFDHVDPLMSRDNLMHAIFTEETTHGFGKDDLGQCRKLNLCR